MKAAWFGCFKHVKHFKDLLQLQALSDDEDGCGADLTQSVIVKPPFEN